MYSIPSDLDYSFNSFSQESAVLQQENITHNASSYSCVTVDILCGSDVLSNALSDMSIEHLHSSINKSIASPSNNSTGTLELVTLQELKVENSDYYLDNNINVNAVDHNLKNTEILEDFNVNEHNISQDNPIGSDSYFTKTLFSFPFFNEAYEMLSTLNSLLKAYDPLPNFPFPVVAAQRGMRPISTPPPRPPSSGTSGRQFNAANNFPSFTANNNVPRASNDNFPGFSSRGNYGNPHPIPNAMANPYNNPSTIPNSYTPTSTPTTYHYGTNGYSTSPNSLGSSYASPPSPVSTSSQGSSSSYNKPSYIKPVRIEPEPFKPIPSISPVNINTPPINTPSISSISSSTVEPFKPIDMPHSTISHDFSIDWERIDREKRERDFYASLDTEKAYLENPWPGYNDYAKREVAQKASYLRHLIRETTKIAVFNNIPIDYSYLRQVLSVNIDVAISTLESGFVLETMFYQSPLYTKGYSQTETNSKTFDKNGGTSGGDGGNQTNTDSGNDPYKNYAQYKTASDRYACPASVSPIWQDAQKWKPKYRTNGAKSRKKEYYRWDTTHSDIEVYDHNARYLRSKDPVTGKLHRPGDMVQNKQLKSLM